MKHRILCLFLPLCTVSTYTMKHTLQGKEEKLIIKIDPLRKGTKHNLGKVTLEMIPTHIQPKRIINSDIVPIFIRNKCTHTIDVEPHSYVWEPLSRFVGISVRIAPLSFQKVCYPNEKKYGKHILEVLHNKQKKSYIQTYTIDLRGAAVLTIQERK